MTDANYFFPREPGKVIEKIDSFKLVFERGGYMERILDPMKIMLGEIAIDDQGRTLEHYFNCFLDRHGHSLDEFIVLKVEKCLEDRCWSLVFTFIESKYYE